MVLSTRHVQKCVGREEMTPFEKKTLSCGRQEERLKMSPQSNWAPFSGRPPKDGAKHRPILGWDNPPLLGRIPRFPPKRFPPENNLQNSWLRELGSFLEKKNLGFLKNETPMPLFLARNPEKSPLGKRFSRARKFCPCLIFLGTSF